MNKGVFDTFKSSSPSQDYTA